MAYLFFYGGIACQNGILEFNDQICIWIVAVLRQLVIELDNVVIDVNGSSLKRF